jgi:hypothetical protein
MKMAVFWDVTPYSLIIKILSFRRNTLPSTLKIGAVSPEALVMFYQTIRLTLLKTAAMLVLFVHLSVRMYHGKDIPECLWEHYILKAD